MSREATSFASASRRLEATLVDAGCSAAAACEAWIGQGDKNAADNAAVVAMRRVLNRRRDRFDVATGEGEMDEAPMLGRGEALGRASGASWDLAVDPLEGTTLCAKGEPGSLTAIAVGDAQSLLPAPDVYLYKVMAGPSCPVSAVHVDSPVSDLVMAAARGADKPVSEIVVCLLDRPRHGELISNVRAAGAQVRLIPDVDIPAALWVCRPELFGVDLFLGSGGAPEGILSAIILKSLGGSMSVRFEPADDRQAETLEALDFLPTERAYSLTDIVRGDAAIVLASVTGSSGLAPVRKIGNGVLVEALLFSTARDARRQPGRRLREIDTSQYPKPC